MILWPRPWRGLKPAATNNNKQANKQLNYTCTYTSINFLPKIFTRYHSTIFRKLALGPCNPRIFRVIGWAQIAISQSHDACAPASEATPQWTVMQLANKVWKDHNATYPNHPSTWPATPNVSVNSERGVRIAALATAMSRRANRLDRRLIDDDVVYCYTWRNRSAPRKQTSPPPAHARSISIYTSNES